ncbi:hypothetical protein IH970_13040 [candidate division KSB1 bacterium]|nr:hypothetical protein [candidate division KSB1 bacterium]
MSTQVQSIENERKLIEACKRGDHRAFEQIYVKYKERIYSLCCYMSGDRETAKDLTQQISKLGFVAEVAILLVGVLLVGRNSGEFCYFYQKV